MLTKQLAIAAALVLIAAPGMALAKPATVYVAPSGDFKAYSADNDVCGAMAGIARSNIKMMPNYNGGLAGVIGAEMAMGYRTDHAYNKNYVVCMTGKGYQAQVMSEADSAAWNAAPVDQRKAWLRDWYAKAGAALPQPAAAVATASPATPPSSSSESNSAESASSDSASSDSASSDSGAPDSGTSPATQ